MLQSVWAVISTFRPDDSLAGVVSAVAEQVAGVVVVDDGTGPDAADALLAARSRGAHVVELAENSGIAVALNRGIDLALAAGADAVVTFDQDSTIPPGFIDHLVQTHAAVRSATGSCGPVVPEFFAEVRQARRCDTHGLLLAENSIQSGMLVDHHVLDAVGPLREDLFIDLVDTEFELRCTAAALPVYAAPGLRLPHRLGAQYAPRGRIGALLPRVVTVSSPFRYFYRARNRILIEREYRSRFAWRLLRDGLADRLYFGIALVIARPRRDLWAVLRAGAHAGRQGIGGRMPSQVAEIARTIRWDADRVDQPGA